VCAWDTAHALHFTVGDTGCGFDRDATPSGAGLSDMHDRIAALGGTLAVDSRPSHGTRLHGRVPDLAGRTRTTATPSRSGQSARRFRRPLGITRTRHEAPNLAAAKHHRHYQQADPGNSLSGLLSTPGVTAPDAG
jgi:hypothetical protein